MVCTQSADKPRPSERPAERRAKEKEGTMGKAESSFWNAVIRHRLVIFTVCVTVLSLYARFAFRGFISPDMNIFLIPWYDAIQEMGGLRALSTQVGNYQISYQTLIALMTYLPIHKVYAYKSLSMAFDYALGLAAAATVRRITGSREKAALTYAAVVLLPVTVLNSAAWGQCDSIFTFFLVLAFFLLLRRQHALMMLSFGMALAFKLQAVFFLPFLLFYYVWSKRFPIRLFLLIPVPVLLFSLGGLAQGRGLQDILQIYTEQGGQYQQISLNYPSFWNLLVITLAEKNADHYSELQAYCLAVTVLLSGAIMLCLIRARKLSQQALLMTASLMMYTCVLFLPAMHERYAYPVLIFAVMLSVLCPKALPVALGMLIIDLQTYGFYLMKIKTLPWDFLVLLNIACYGWMAFLTWKTVRVQEPEGASCP